MHAGGGVVLLSCGLLASAAGIADNVAQYGALGVMAFFFLIVMPRMEEAREKRRMEQFKLLIKALTGKTPESEDS